MVDEKKFSVEFTLKELNIIRDFITTSDWYGLCFKDHSDEKDVIDRISKIIDENEE